MYNDKISQWVFIEIVAFFVLIVQINGAMNSFGSWLINDELNEKMNAMKFTNCGGPKTPIKLFNLNTNPKVFRLPGNLSISATVEVKRDIYSPIQVQTVVSKELPFVGLVELPCVKSFGSCGFEDICPWLELGKLDMEYVTPNITNACAWIHAFGFPCNCPIKQGKYVVTNANLPLAESLLPKWVETGKYKSAFRMWDKHGTVACMKFEFMIS